MPPRHLLLEERNRTQSPPLLRKSNRARCVLEPHRALALVYKIVNAKHLQSTMELFPIESISPFGTSHLGDLLPHALLMRLMLIGQTAVTAVTLLCILSGLVIELLCLFGEGELQRGVTVLSHEELLEVTVGFFGIQREGILPILLQTGIIAVEVPVTALHSFFSLPTGSGPCRTSYHAQCRDNMR